MPRILHLVGLSLAAAATGTVSCQTRLLSKEADCQSCVAIGSSSVCTNFTAAARPTCVEPMCGTSPCPAVYSGPVSNCGVCVYAILDLIPVCIQTTSNIGFALTSSLDFGASVDLSAAFDTTPMFAEINATATEAITAAASVVRVTASNIATIAVGASTAASVALFDVKSTAADANVAVTTWDNNAGSAKVENSAKLTIGSLQTGGSYFSVWQNASTSLVTFNNIDFSSRAQFSGPSVVHVAGGSASVDASGVKFSSGGSGTLKLTGGATIATTQGSLPQALTINITSQGQSAPLAVVEATLSTLGDISGSASAVLVVNGQLNLGTSATKVQPQVVVNGGASSKVTIDSSATTFVASDVQVGAAATLELGAKTYELAKNGALMFNKLWVDAQGHVKIYQSAAARAATDAGQAVVAFNYSASVNVAALAQATVTVVTTSGASVKLTSTTTVAAGRRLLAGTNTATWGPNGLSYTYDGSANGAAQLLVLPVMLIGLFGLFL